MERRLNSRTPSNTKVRLYYNGHGRLDGRLRDFSQSGVYICLDKKYAVPTVGEKIVMLAENMDEPYTMEAVRIDSMELALVFKD